MAATRTSSSFITSVALVAVCCCCCCCCSAAAVATPPDLSCDHRLLDNGSLVLQLKGTSSGSLDLLFSSWADENDTKFVEGAQFDSDKVLSVNNNSATLRKCQNQVLFTYMGQNLLMVRCNVTCPPEGQPVETWNVGVPVTISVAAVLIFFPLMVVFMKWKLFCVREHLQAPGRAEVL